MNSVLYSYTEFSLALFSFRFTSLPYRYVIRTWTCTVKSCRGTTIGNDWVCSFRETWLFSRSWRNNQVAISRVTIRHRVYDNLRSCFPEVEVSGLANFAPKICPPRMSKTKIRVIYLLQMFVVRIIP